jgi:hypothetical protein
VLGWQGRWLAHIDLFGALLGLIDGVADGVAVQLEREAC